MTHATYKKYETYKDSGIAQIAEIPNHWKIRRLKDVAFIQYSNVDKKTYEDEIPVKLCNYVDVYKNDFISSSLLFMQATANQSEIKRFTVKKHDVLVTKDSETAEDIANPALAVENLSGVLCGYHLAQIRPIKNMLYAPFLFRLLQSDSYGFRFVIYAKGITRVGLSTSAFSDALTPIPSLVEQKEIADYLDEKTAVIDHKIDLLTQKAVQYQQLKQALINETVTRGLNKTAPLKDSGIDWLGEIPAHWEVTRLKNTMHYSRNGAWGEEANGEGDDIVCIRVADFDRPRLRLLDQDLTIRSLSRHKRKNLLLTQGDLLLEKSGGGELQPVGQVVLFDLSIPAITSNFVAKMVVKESNSSNFLCYLYSMLYARRINTRSIKQNTGIQNLDSKAYFNEKVGLPPLSEQKEIADYLDTKTAHIDRIIETIHSQIETLQELRKTLINDVVTGKIKVVG